MEDVVVRNAAAAEAARVGMAMRSRDLRKVAAPSPFALQLLMSLTDQGRRWRRCAAVFRAFFAGDKGLDGFTWSAFISLPPAAMTTAAASAMRWSAR